MAGLFTRWGLVLALFTLASCAVYMGHELDELYGQATVRSRLVPHDSVEGVNFRTDIKPILDKRCVVCHGCYDAPCQLKLSSPEGVDRGASKEVVYNGARIKESPLTRLFIDGDSAQDWRNLGFHPVLNERGTSVMANTAAGVLSRMLALKRQHPLPVQKTLPDSFNFSSDRNQECPSIESFDQFAREKPLWGMPYGLPGLAEVDYQKLDAWLKAGAPLAEVKPLAKTYSVRITEWESFFNQRTLKGQLVARYIYEHLYLANLYFDDLPNRQYFHMVRSYTAPGKAISVIATRRPFDDPGVSTFYYRLQRVESTILAKTHMPYALGTSRMARWLEWFFLNPYSVKALPSYESVSSSNPFRTFQSIPVNARYRFILDEAQFSIMGFIKGPVCRGQVALNVINDHFWVFFLNPNDPSMNETTDFLAEKSSHLHLPAEASSTLLPLHFWREYSK